MATANQMFTGFQQQFALLGNKISNFFAFIASRLANYAKLTLAERISFAATGLGLLLILISIVLFIL